MLGARSAAYWCNIISYNGISSISSSGSSSNSCSSSGCGGGNSDISCSTRKSSSSLAPPMDYPFTNFSLVNNNNNNSSFSVAISSDKSSSNINGACINDRSSRGGGENDENDGVEVIYVCGDSHTLPLSWAVLPRESSSAPCLLVPKLVTGVKHWHLRPESNFYPKANFFNAVRSIPNGAKVIFVIGEIDCREGILVAVEKGRYGSIEEGINSTISVFVQVLKDLIAMRGFQVGKCI